MEFLNLEFHDLYSVALKNQSSKELKSRQFYGLVAPVTVQPTEIPVHTHPLTEEDLEVLRGCCFDDTRYEQYYRTRKKIEADQCAFCQIDEKVNKILYNRWGWIAWEVPTAFTNRQSTLDLLLVFFPKRHIRHLNELSIFEWIGLYLIIRWIYKTYKGRIPGGGFLARVGDMRWNVGTVMHLHFQFLVPNRKGEVKVYFQKALAQWEAEDARMQQFSARYEAGEVPAGM